MRRSFQASPNAYYREMDGEMIMGELLHTVTTMPAERRSGCPFDPPAELLDAHRHGPISHYTFPGGEPGWLITGYDLVRSVLADSRFSSRRSSCSIRPSTTET